MIKKEINEIKSLFDTIQDCNILKLAGCYVNGEKEKVKSFCESFYNLPEEEMYKYLEIFRKTLSGTPGKNLLDMGFVDQEGSSSESGKGLLLKLKKSELKDDAVLESFYDKVIENYNYVGNYLILLIFQSYDVPGMTTDGIEMDDASDEVYSYVLCSICPMKLTKPGLGFDDDLGEIHTLRQIFAVELPDTGFLFPAFNDRSSDDSAILYSCKRTDQLQDRFLENVLGVSTTLPAKQQKEGFTEFVADVLGEETSFETVLSIQENLSETIKNRKNEAEGETVFLDKHAVRNVFESSGVSQEKLEKFDKKFDEQFDVKRLQQNQIENEIGDENLEVEGTSKNSYVPQIKVEEKLFADNVVPVRNFEVKTKDMVLRINSKHTDILETKVIDGKKCLVIELTDDLTVNGIPVK
ncbi:MAG: DUF4317 domain-containing protein [Eubacterium sp.]|nr:DUF4317 domain-containing protein [Eubacterium sp.]